MLHFKKCLWLSGTSPEPNHINLLHDILDSLEHVRKNLVRRELFRERPVHLLPVVGWQPYVVSFLGTQRAKHSLDPRVTHFDWLCSFAGINRRLELSPAEIALDVEAADTG